MQSGDRWSCQITRLSRRMSSLWAARRAFETIDTSHRVRRALLARVHTKRIVTGELFFVWRKFKKNRTDARTALVTHRWCGPAIVDGKEKKNVFVSYRGRVTKVAPEFLRKASVAEQMSWDITKPCSERHSSRKTSRGKNPCSMNLVNFMNPRCQTRWRGRRTSKKMSIHP